ncbi:N-acetyltransferase family protein [Streptomyces sp. NPDC001185]|uniref:GNAT family N-acetyltransferase n=1 Tax=Streptomyces sp. NPDC001185 TaxID=3154380 RepID=UPI0033303C2B
MPPLQMINRIACRGQDVRQSVPVSGPYRILVARQGTQVLGYACTQRYRDQDAFRETVEVSIGLVERSRGQGLGTALYQALFSAVDSEPVHVILAGIALPNENSVALHKKFGFSEIGTFKEYAVKNGQYLSSLWMQRLKPAESPDLGKNYLGIVRTIMSGARW